MALDVEQVVRREVTVEASQERCFEVFTAGFDSWWPRESHHIGEADAQEVVIEPRVGGRWLERGVDGSECTWGRVLEWDPPRRIRLSWQLNAQWQFDPDEAVCTFVEATFTPLADGSTQVELVHSGFKRAADGAVIRDAVSRDGGWGSLLELYGAEAASRA
jgi:uncharacterized protein YndB with AHSA1/START domain